MASAPAKFPVGYHSLHPDVSMNFQMNRWFGWVGEPEMLEEMRMAALRSVYRLDLGERHAVPCASGPPQRIPAGVPLPTATRQIHDRLLRRVRQLYRGRVFKNVPAPTNLTVPPYHFTSDSTLVIGADQKS